MTHLDYLNQNYPIRKSTEQKQGFQKYIVDLLAKKGIEARIETTKDGKNQNIVVGDPTKAKAVFTAHYDTPARSIFPNIMIPQNKLVFYAYQFVPVLFLVAVSLLVGYIVGNLIFNSFEVFYFTFMIAYYGLFFGIMRGFANKFNYNDNTSGVATVLSIIDGLSADELQNFAFILFDNEEKGKKGSAAYYKDNSDDMKGRFLVNFDCVGNGNNVVFIAQKDAVDSSEFGLLKQSFVAGDNFSLDFCSYKEGQSNSDHKNFPKGVACVACKKSNSGLLYTPNIHTSRDVVVDNKNIDFIAKNTLLFIRRI